jgi:predicted O-linked N-acetylglucosamine transferase (SPINDLY family)
MDYWIGDDVVTPKADDDHFVEKVWRLPRVMAAYKPIANAPQPHWRPVSDGTVCLGSFHHLAKINSQTIELWAKVLNALPEGRLLLKTAQLADVGNRQRILNSLAALGVGADRIDLQDGANTPDMPSHLAYYDHLDIALDPVGSNSGLTTTSDALWMAVPVVTLLGDRMGSRSAASILKSVGHEELVATTESGYIDTVVALARDPSRLFKLRNGLRDEMIRSALSDAPNLARLLEDAYVAMYQQWFAANGI